MSSAGPQRQSISYLTRRFREVGLEPNARHGQNFLIDLNLQQLIADRAELGPNDVALEIGTGTGGLTCLLAERAGTVLTVEVDQRMYHLASEELIDYANVTMLLQDALRNKNTLDGSVIAELHRQLAAAPGRQYKLVANLAYNIATPIISNLLSVDPLPASMTVTIQKEVADRITAAPATKDYGALSIWIQSQCTVEIVRVLPPQVFWPRPKVTSAIIHIVPQPALRERIPDLAFFHRFTRSMFLHRRKFMRSTLVASYKQELGKQGVDEVMEQLNFGATSRAEELSIEQMLALCEVVRAKLRK